MSGFSFAVLGGDRRYDFLKNILTSQGHFVKIYKENSPKTERDTIENFLKGSDILIGPLPFTKDGRTLFLPSLPTLTIEELFSAMKKTGVYRLISGLIPKEARERGLNFKVTSYDFFDCSSVAVLNAVPTAEGALATAINESPVTLFGSSSLIIGFGRCGKALTKLLCAVGSKVTVTSRNPETSAYIRLFGASPLDISELEENLSGFDFIFNTAPANILTAERLKSVRTDALIIDLAQAPGGTDFAAATELGIKALYCPSLPGRCAPKTAAKILSEAIEEITTKFSL